MRTRERKEPPLIRTVRGISRDDKNCALQFANNDRKIDTQVKGELQDSFLSNKIISKTSHTLMISPWNGTRLVHTSKEPVCPRVELIFKIINILLIIFLGFIKSKPC